MSTRAGILVTGTEVLSGIISDRNGPWLSARLRERGIDLAHLIVVGDRSQDMLAALEFLGREDVDVIVTSGGLGPTADDLTAEIVARFCGRERVLDEQLERRIAEIIAPMRKRWPQLDDEAIRSSNRKQAVVPEGATVLAPVGTAPGLVLPPAEGRDGPTVVVLPGPPRELQPMWDAAVQTEAFRAATTATTVYRQGIMRLFGIPESEIAATLRALASEGVPLSGLEITTCLRRGEIEIATRYEPDAEELYRGFLAAVSARHRDTLFSVDATTIDDLVAKQLSDGSTVATAESCTGGLLAARLTERPGASAYVLGGLVVYDDDAKVRLAGVDPAVIAAHGAVSTEVAVALADGARMRLDAALGVGITGVAGPDGGTAAKPVGRVCLSVSGPGEMRLTRSVDLPGDRLAVRDRSVTVAMHMLHRVLLGEHDGPRIAPGGERSVPAR